MATLAATVVGEISRNKASAADFGIPADVRMLDADGARDLALTAQGLGDRLPARLGAAGFAADGVDGSATRRAFLSIISGVDWQPQILEPILVRTLETTTEDERFERDLDKAGQEVVTREQSARRKEYFFVTIIFANSGRQTTSTEKFAAASVHGLKKPILLIRVDEDMAVAVQGGDSKIARFRSARPLDPEDSDKLHKLYDTEVVSFIVATRSLSHEYWQGEWITSDISTFSSYGQKVEDMYAHHFAGRSD
jgi:hypothetical protein